MAFNIAKQDKRKSVQLTITIPAALNDELTLWGKEVDGDAKYVAVEVLTQACADRNATKKSKQTSEKVSTATA